MSGGGGRFGDIPGPMYPRVQGGGGGGGGGGGSSGGGGRRRPSPSRGPSRPPRSTEGGEGGGSSSSSGGGGFGGAGIPGPRFPRTRQGGSGSGRIGGGGGGGGGGGMGGPHGGGGHGGMPGPSFPGSPSGGYGGGGMGPGDFGFGGGHPGFGGPSFGGPGFGGPPVYGGPPMGPMGGPGMGGPGMGGGGMFPPGFPFGPGGFGGGFPGGGMMGPSFGGRGMMDPFGGMGGIFGPPGHDPFGQGGGGMPGSRHYYANPRRPRSPGAAPREEYHEHRRTPSPPPPRHRSSQSRPIPPYFDEEAFLKRDKVSTEEYDRLAKEFMDSALRENTKDESGKLECIVCFDDTKPDKLIQNPNCMHLLCHDCASDMFRSAINTKDLPARCCKAEVPISIIEESSLLKNSEIKKYNELLVEVTADAQSRLYCSNRKCGKFIPPGSATVKTAEKKPDKGKSRFGGSGFFGSGRRHHHYGDSQRVVDDDGGPDADNVTCPACKKQTCRHCKAKAHPNQLCKEDEATKELLKLGKESGWVRCPRCGVMVERKGGCMIMTCVCHFSFCIYCSEPWVKCAGRCIGSKDYSTRELERWLYMNPGFG